MGWLNWVMRVRGTRIIALLGMGLMVVGCTTVVSGSAQSARKFSPQRLTGQAITQVLLGDQALSRLLDEPFVIDPRLPPQFGGPETLRDAGSVAPSDCLGVAEMLHQSVYPAGKVSDVAAAAWRHAAVAKKVTDVKEGVVSLPTADEADALFARFAQEWQRCEGHVAALPDEVLRLKATISNVQIAPRVLAATVSIAFAGGSDTGSVLVARALGVRRNCLVEVEVDFFNASSRTLRGSSAVNAIPIDIAQTMMGRVSELS